MKRLIGLIIFKMIMICSVFGQSPEAVNYQVVARDNSGNLLASQDISFRLSIRQDSTTGTVVYSETHATATNQFGVAVLAIGKGTVVSGSFSTIDWGSDSYYLETEVDPAGGSDYISMGVSQFISVPYSFYSKDAGNGIPDGTKGNTLRHDGTNWVADFAIYNDSSRVGIGTSSPDLSSILELKSGTNGFLVPRMTKAKRQAITAPAQGLLVYQTDSESGFYYNHGNSDTPDWQFFGGNWNLAGNNGTDPDNQFVGTTDNKDLAFRTNNTERVRIAGDGSSLFPSVHDALNLGSAMNSFKDISLSGTLRLDGSVFLDNPGTKNSFIGVTGNSTNTGANNTFLGYNAGKVNTSGYDNLFSGVESGVANTTGYCNTAAGFQSLYSNAGGWNNTAHGYGSLYNNSSGVSNSALGVGSMYSNTTGNRNTAIGYGALYSNSSGDSSVAIGYMANVNAGNLSDVVVIGSGATATASDQVRLGNSHVQSLYCMGAYNSTTAESPNLYVSGTGQIMRSTSGGGGGIGGAGTPTDIAFWSTPAAITSDANFHWDNVNKRLGIGTGVPTQQFEITKNMNLPHSTPATGNIYKNGILFLHNFGLTESKNTFLGLNAGNVNPANSFMENTGVGFESLKNLTTGYANTALGTGTLSVNTTGSANTAVGMYAMSTTSTGGYNTAIGSAAMRFNTTGEYNTALGSSALGSNTDGTANIAIGVGAMGGVAHAGIGNVAVGDGALTNNSGNANTCIGGGAMINNKECGRNTALGYQSLYQQGNAYGDSAVNNTAVGYQSMFFTAPMTSASGRFNAAFGYQSLYANTIGFNNTAIGYQSLLANTSGVLNTALGYKADVTAGNFINATAVGANVTATGSNQVRLGDAAVTALYCQGAFAGIVGVPNHLLYADNTGKIGNAPSSARYKDQIEDMETTEWIYRLRPVNFSYKSDVKQTKQYGLIAEEVEIVNPSFVEYDREGRPESVSYVGLIAPMVKILQEQKAVINSQKERIDQLERMITIMSEKIDQHSK